MESEPSVRIYVVGSSDSVFHCPDDPSYVKYYTDANYQKDNINQENHVICELSGLYYLWKNESAEIVGLEHYRRMFEEDETRLSLERINELLSENDIIISKYRWTSPNRETLSQIHMDHLDDYIAMSDSLLPGIEKYIESEMDSYDIAQGNRFICRKQFINEYCEYIFRLYGMIKERFTLNPREFGYYAEYTFMAYLKYKGIKYHAVGFSEYSKTGDDVFHYSVPEEYKKNAMMLLTGYKPYLYDLVFDRIEKFLPDDFDLYIVTAGVGKQKRIEDFAKKMDAEYIMYQQSNNSGEAMNACVASIAQEGKHYKYLLKCDEDIFITEHSIETMVECYEKAETVCMPGFIAPLLNVNGNCYQKILADYGKTDEWISRFGKIKYGNWNDYMEIEGSESAARFMWGEDGIIPGIDSMNRDYQIDGGDDFMFAKTRYSIGMVLMSFPLFIKRGMFSAFNGHVDDEYALNSLFALGYPPVICCKTLCGHFSFFGQVNGMKTFLDEHPENFSVN